MSSLRVRSVRVVTLTLLSAFFSLALRAQPEIESQKRVGVLKSKGEVALETRSFDEDHDENTVDQGIAGFARLDLSYRYSGWQAALRGYSRTDQKDSDRDLTAVEDAWFGWRNANWDLRLGYQMLNWTATEAFHPADMINSRNYDSNIENADKLGEPMLSLKRALKQGSLTLYYMPRFIAPRFPGPHSRLSFLPGISLGQSEVLESNRGLSEDRNIPQWGLRFAKTLGDADLSLFYVDHVDRTSPSFFFELGRQELLPVYQNVRESGLTYQHVLGPLILKLEASHRDFETLEQLVIVPFPEGRPDHTAAAFGFEYGTAWESGSETTLLFEGQNLFGLDKVQRAALAVFQRDFLFGVRHGFNDALSRELLFTFLFDGERGHEWLMNLSYSQRLNDVFSLKAGARLVDAPPKLGPAQGLQALDGANQLSLSLTRYF